MKIRRKNHYPFDPDYILVTILLVFSGDPITRYLGKYAILFISVLIFIAFYKSIKRNFYTLFIGIASGLLLIFISQYFVLGYTSWLGAFNYIVTYLLGGLIIYILAERFPSKLFIIISYISVLSLILFIPINLLSLHLPSLEWKPNRFTYGIYTYVEQHRYRNCGIFWEPGAFAGILTLCLALNVKDFPVLWQKHKFKFAAVVVALMTTQSTTGYVVFFLIGCYFLLFFVKDKSIAFTVLPVLLVVGIAIYSNAAFLKDKVESQSEASAVLYKGEFSNTRFGSFIFDMNYIKKHPIIGNGFDEITRYADNPEIIQLIHLGQDPANGNGISNYMACLGVPFLLIYFLLSFNAVSQFDRKTSILVTIVIALSLISEQWLTYPIFTGIMFMRNKKLVE